MPKRVANKITLQTREEIAKMTLMNNDFMNLALEDNIPCVEEMLRVILEKQDLVVKTARTQKFFQGFKRSVYLDVFAEDSNGVLYNIEIQQADEGADPRRARFHTGMIDVHNLKAGQDFKELPECYVIFITLNDVLGMNQTIYTIHKYIDGSMKPFDDGSHLIYINGSAKDDGTEVGKLVHDLRCTKADEMFYPRLAARIKFLKEDEEGVKIVSDYFEELRTKAIKQAHKKDMENIAIKLLQLGKLTVEEIARCSGLTLKKVQMLATTL
ncbi:MAG: PD-(D/E)XK nuclease family transposase [Synergistaceae bacterium]|nr:PD-(D/E)XK nuclease family transposase [Synergistaceae bacterium]